MNRRSARPVACRAAVAGTVLAFLLVAQATPEPELVPSVPFITTPEQPGLDLNPPAAKAGASDGLRNLSGPIGPASSQPAGALSGRIVFTSAGHGWAWTGSSWALGRGVLQQMSEDYGNLDQMTMFVFYCFNAGATVVPFRPVGHQTNEVILDNTSPGVTWQGDWADSSSTVYYGVAGAVPYRYAALAASETATATYTPTFPAEGFYPVYAWALSGANRTNQLYRINHSGGQALVRVPHHMVGNGWVYLGTYFFATGSNSARGAVVISNLGEGAVGQSVVIADAVRCGNGMGDVDRGGGVSSYPREEECSRYWIQRSLGQGQSSTIYDVAGLGDDSDNVGAPIRMAVEMNRAASESMYKRVYVGFHSNAGGGRGVVGLYNDPTLSTNVAPKSNTPNQFRLAQLVGAEINNDLAGIPSPPLELAWYNRGANVTFARSDYAFGEINNNTINGAFDATIAEVAFHDDPSDAKLLRDPKARNWVARAACQAVVRYVNQFDAVPLNFLPEPPSNVRVIASNGAVVVSWSAPVTQGGSGAPAGYRVSQSANGFGFAAVSAVAAPQTSVLLTNAPPGTDLYFRVSAWNAGGESLPSETVGCRVPASPASARVLFVNGFTRFDRGLNLRQTPAPLLYKPPGHDANSGAMDRVIPRANNAFDYVVSYGKAIAGASLMGFDSCCVQAVTNNQVNLADYAIVIWACGNQSTADRTFNSAAQNRVAAFLSGGGNLMVSGSEVGWDLDRASGPSAADRNFFHQYLHAALKGDTNDDSGIYSFAPATGSLFSGNPAGLFDDGSRGIYWVGYPDALTPSGPGAFPVLQYPGYVGGAAATIYDGSAGTGRVVLFGFPFETITNPSLRTQYLADVLKWLSPGARLELASLPGDTLRIRLWGEPGFAYTVQESPDLSTWRSSGEFSSTNGLVEFNAPAGPEPRRYLRAVLRF